MEPGDILELHAGDEIPRLGSGYFRVEVLKAGRKWCVVRKPSMRIRNVPRNGRKKGSLGVTLPAGARCRVRRNVLERLIRRTP